MHVDTPYLVPYPFFSIKSHSSYFRTPAIKHCQTLQTWIDHNVTCCYNLIALPNCTFSLNLAWFETIWNVLPYFTVKYINIC